MLRSFQFVLPAWLAMAVWGLLLGQATATPPLPAWQDNASVYLKTDGPAETPAAGPTTSGGAKPDQLPDAAVSAPLGATGFASGSSAAAAALAEPVAPERQNTFSDQVPDAAVSVARYDAPVMTATSAVEVAAEAPSDAQRDHRRLAPPTANALARAQSSKPHLLPGFDIPLDSIYAMLTALALVVGLFLLCAWALRRGTRSSSAVLPGEVVSVLGRVPLAARQFAQLLRVGNKLVLVSVTPAGAETLAEVSDPAEVDRLLGICQQLDPKSTTREFEAVFRQLAGQPVPDAFIERDAPATRDVYEAYRGGTARG